MNKFSLICLLLLFVSPSVSCEVWLNYICPNITFTFDGVLVNAFHEFKTNFTFHPFKHYLAEDRFCDWRSFSNHQDAKVLDKLRETYNNLISKYYTEDFANNYNTYHSLDLFYSRSIVIPAFKKTLEDLIFFENTSTKDNCTYRVLLRIKNGEPFITTLSNYLDGRFNPHNNPDLRFNPRNGLTDKEEWIPTKDAEMAKLKKLIDSLEPDENQIFALANFSVEEIYYRYIVKAQKFSIKQWFLAFLLFDTDKTGTLFYSIQLPFHTKIKYPPSQSCAGRKELAYWFRHPLFRTTNITYDQAQDFEKTYFTEENQKKRKAEKPQLVRYDLEKLPFDVGRDAVRPTRTY